MTSDNTTDESSLEAKTASFAKDKWFAGDMNEFANLFAAFYNAAVAESADAEKQRALVFRFMSWAFMEVPEFMAEMDASAGARGIKNEWVVAVQYVGSRLPTAPSSLQDLKNTLLQKYVGGCFTVGAEVHYRLFISNTGKVELHRAKITKVVEAGTNYNLVYVDSGEPVENAKFEKLDLCHWPW